MKQKIATFFAVIGWFAIIAQYCLMVQISETSITVTTIKFFSFFTILTNSIVAIYFTCIVLYKNQTATFLGKPGTLSAITIYILVVGLVYQLVLRQLWHPTGLQRVVDELLHSLIPILVIIFWYLYERTQSIKYAQIPSWLAYPLTYLIYILIRGQICNCYPYPFVDVTTLGMKAVLINSGILFAVFAFLSLGIIYIGKLLIKSQ